MSIGLIFWVIMLLWMLSWFGTVYAPGQYPFAAHAGNLMFFILLFLLGWHAFGFIVHA